jgi:hypothetical protein
LPLPFIEVEPVPAGIKRGKNALAPILSSNLLSVNIFPHLIFLPTLKPVLNLIQESLPQPISESYLPVQARRQAVFFTHSPDLSACANGRQALVFLFSNETF